jgi:hypothetical protein
MEAAPHDGGVVSLARGRRGEMMKEEWRMEKQICAAKFLTAK